MWKVVILMIILHCPEVTLAKGRKSNRNKWNNTVGFPDMRSFGGTFVKVDPIPLPTSTEDHTCSSSSLSATVAPALELLSNSTVDYLAGPLSRRVIPVIYIVAVAVGIPVNVAILASLASKVRTISSAILYCSLATSDLLLLLSLVLKVHYHLGGNDWPFGELSCRLTTACFYGNLYCSAHTLACLSVKRYVAIVHPFLYKSLPKRSCAAIACAAVWLVFAVSTVPVLLTHQTYRLPQLGVVTCHDVLPVEGPHATWLPLYNLGLTCFGFFVPLLVMVASYSSIVWSLKGSSYDWSLYIRASTLVFIIFAVCFGPSSTLHFLHYVRLYTSGEENFYAYFNLAVCLCCLHSCLDPFLFLLMSRTTRSHVTTSWALKRNLLASRFKYKCAMNLG